MSRIVEIVRETGRRAGRGVDSDCGEEEAGSEKRRRKLILIHIKLISHILTICLMKRIMNESGLGSVI